MWATGQGRAQGGDLGVVVGLDKVEPALLSEMGQRGNASYLLYLQEQAPLTGVETITDRDARGQVVFESLKETAARTQAPILAFLETERQAGRVTEIKSFFSANTIGVTSTSATLETVATFPEVAWIGRATAKKVPKPSRGTPQATVAGVEWNMGGRATQPDFPPLLTARPDTPHPGLVPPAAQRVVDGITKEIGAGLPAQVARAQRFLLLT